MKEGRERRKEGKEGRKGNKEGNVVIKKRVKEGKKE
jgi:hypothetical protein